MDHYHQIGNIGPPTDPMLEAYTLLGAVAARTTRVKLGAMVTGVTYRNPAFLAKVVTTLDVISAGRAILGIGAAWNEEESLAFGYPWPSATERFERLEDALRICRSMFTTPESTVQGSIHHVDGAINMPQPVAPAARRSSSAAVGRRRRSCSPRGTPTCGTGSAMSPWSGTSSTSSRRIARRRGATAPRSSPPASAR